MQYAMRKQHAQALLLAAHRLIMIYIFSYAINLLLPFHYRIRKSAEWSIWISLCPLLARRYCVAESVAVDPNAFVVASDAYADGCGDDGDGGFAGAG